MYPDNLSMASVMSQDHTAKAVKRTVFCAITTRMSMNCSYRPRRSLSNCKVMPSLLLKKLQERRT